MARRQRLRYDPPHARKKGSGRRAGPPPRPDQIFMTRRMFLAKGAVVAAFTTLAGRLGWMQIRQGEEYQRQARSNITELEYVTAPRGAIYDAKGRELARNDQTWEVRVLPARLPDADEQPEERVRVFDHLINALDLPDALVLDKNQVPPGKESFVYARTAQLLEKPDLAAWTTYIQEEQKNNYLVRLEDDLSADRAALCRAFLHEVPGARVVNRLEYLVENGREHPEVPVRTGVSREVALKLEANKLSLPGVELAGGVLQRAYPGGEAMSHVLGYVSANVTDDERQTRDEDGNPIYLRDDFIGRVGLEGELEPALRGKRGSRVVQISPYGGPGQVVDGTERPPVPGKNVRLTIDLELQRAASEIVRGGIEFSNADRRAIAARDPNRPIKKESGAGCVVAIDPRNGEVLAMVSVPHYDNQLFVDGISTRKYHEYESKEANLPLLDRALRGVYPPGSTLKPFIAAAALHERKIDTARTYTCTGGIMVPNEGNEANGQDHPCWSKEGHGALDVFGGIERSCDVFFYNAGTPRQTLGGGPDVLHYRDLNPQTGQVGERHDFEGLGIDLIKEHLGDRFWFGETTKIDLPAEDPADGLWVRHDDTERFWSAGDTINVSIGQGEFVTTPLQLALNTAALANGGTIHRPRLVREEFGEGRGGARPFAPEELRKLGYAADILGVVKEGMRRVVHSPQGSAFRNADGSSKWALTNPPGEEEIRIAGKTGTAERGEQDENGNYSIQHAWFTAFAPLDEPEIAIAVLVEDGGEGSSYAVPVADRVLRAFFELSGRRPRGTVLRPEGLPDDRDASVLAAAAAFPQPGVNATPASQNQD